MPETMPDMIVVKALGGAPMDDHVTEYGYVPPAGEWRVRTTYYASRETTDRAATPAEIEALGL